MMGIELVDHIVMGDGIYVSVFYYLKSRKGELGK